jgi:HPt (histidine-containing phosphotransfer) domain-containing protein
MPQCIRTGQHMDPDPGSETRPPEVLDPQALAKLGQLDPSGQNALVRRVLATYASSLAGLRKQIADGHAAADAAGLRLGAHTLKSSSASVGALALSGMCAAVEQALREQREAELPAMVAKLLAEIDVVDDAVQRHIQQLGTAR